MDPPSGMASAALNTAFSSTRSRLPRNSSASPTALALRRERHDRRQRRSDEVGGLVYRDVDVDEVVFESLVVPMVAIDLTSPRRGDGRLHVLILMAMSSADRRARRVLDLGEDHPEHAVQVVGEALTMTLDRLGPQPVALAARPWRRSVASITACPARDRPRRSRRPTSQRCPCCLARLVRFVWADLVRHHPSVEPRSTLPYHPA